MNKMKFFIIPFIVLVISLGYLFRYQMPWRMAKARKSAEQYMNDKYGCNLKSGGASIPLIESIWYRVSFDTEYNNSFEVYVNTDLEAYGDDFVKKTIEGFFEHKYGDGIKKSITKPTSINYKVDASKVECEKYYYKGIGLDEDGIIKDFSYEIVIYSDETNVDINAESVFNAITYINNSELNVSEIRFYAKSNSYKFDDLEQYNEISEIKKKMK